MRLYSCIVVAHSGYVPNVWFFEGKTLKQRRLCYSRCIFILKQIVLYLESIRDRYIKLEHFQKTIGIYRRIALQLRMKTRKVTLDMR